MDFRTGIERAKLREASGVSILTAFYKLMESMAIRNNHLLSAGIARYASSVSSRARMKSSVLSLPSIS